MLGPGARSPSLPSTTNIKEQHEGVAEGQQANGPNHPAKFYFPKPKQKNNMKSLDLLAQQVHTANKKWWQNIDTGAPLSRNKGELLGLIHSEISEAFDAELLNMKDDKLPHRLGGEVEMADALIRMLDYSAGFGYSLDGPMRDEFGFISPQLGSKIAELMTSSTEHEEVFAIYLALENHSISIIHSAVSKLLEAERKGKTEKAPALICHIIMSIVCYCRIKQYDIDGAYTEKMAFNAKREDHTHEARRIAGGKQF